MGRTRLRLDYSFFWILTFAAWAQNDLLWQVLLFSVLHECGHLTALCALGLQPRQLRLSFYGMALRYDRVPDRRRETAVLFGGPAVNLILWVLLRDPANGALFLLNMPNYSPRAIACSGCASPLFNANSPRPKLRTCRY